jgi:hypothetical protein
VKAQGTQILFQVFDAFSARDRHNIFALRQHPREGQLRGCASLLASHLFDSRRELDVALKIVTLESRRVSAHIIGRKIFKALELAGEKAASQRAIGNEADAELAANTQDAVLGIAGPKGVFVLERGDGMHGVRATQSLGTRFGHADVTDFAFLDEFLHCAERVLDWYVGIDAVLVIEVDIIDAEPSQARLAGAADVIRFSVNISRCEIFEVALITEFRCEDDFVAPSFNGLADQFFVFERAVHVGGVEQGDAEVKGAMNGRDGFALIARAIKFGHAHATESERRDAQTAFSEFACFHSLYFP